MAKNKNNKMNAQQSKYNAEFASETNTAANASTKAASQKAEK